MPKCDPKLFVAKIKKINSRNFQFVSRKFCRCFQRLVYVNDHLYSYNFDVFECGCVCWSCSPLFEPPGTFVFFQISFETVQGKSCERFSIRLLVFVCTRVIPLNRCVCQTFCGLFYFHRSRVVLYNINSYKRLAQSILCG